MGINAPFREFFNKEEIDFKNMNEDVLVIFDTNTLLNIYRYSEETKSILIDAINRIKGNIWMPYQVGLEFNLRRRGILEEMRLSKEKCLTGIKNDFVSELKKANKSLDSFKLKSRDAIDKKKDIGLYLEGKLKEIQDELYLKVDDWINSIDLDNDLAGTIAELFDGKIGECYTQEILDEKLKAANERYINEIPPGYCDNNKKKDGEYIKTYYNGIEFETRFGDLIAWYQILDKAKDPKIKRVVLITDDNKEDWWYQLKGKTVGPRAELKNELLRNSQADLFMFNSNSFLNAINKQQDLIEVEMESSNGLEKQYNLSKSNLEDTLFTLKKNINDLSERKKELLHQSEFNQLLIDDAMYQYNKNLEQNDIQKNEIINKKLSIHITEKKYFEENIKEIEAQLKKLNSDKSRVLYELNLIDFEFND